MSLVISARECEPRHIFWTQTFRAVGPGPSVRTVAGVARVTAAGAVSTAGNRRTTRARAHLDSCSRVATVTTGTSSSEAVGCIVIRIAKAVSCSGVANTTVTANTVFFGAGDLLADC